MKNQNKPTNDELRNEMKRLKGVIGFQREKLKKMYNDTMKSFNLILREIDKLGK